MNHFRPSSPTLRRLGHRASRSLAALSAAALLAMPLAAPAMNIGGENFADRIRMADAELLLNGVGLRAVAWIKGYAAGLYLRERAATPQQVVAVKGPKRVQIRMLLDVDAKEFAKAFNVGIRRNTTADEQSTMGAEMTQFDTLIEGIGAVKKGDVINLDFVPARGVVLTLNGASRGEPIASAPLYAGILKIFVGEQPVDRKLKEGLLGQKPA